MEILKEIISLKEFNEWNLYNSYNIDPLERIEYYLANLTCIIANSNRDPVKRPTPFKLEDFLLFKDDTINSNSEEKELSKKDEILLKHHISLISKKRKK